MSADRFNASEPRRIEHLESERLVRELHLAICGAEELGVRGLAKDVQDLKSWRQKMDLRVAGIAGGISVLAIVAKRFLEHL